jgi:predicted dienelactone hydrolase
MLKRIVRITGYLVLGVVILIGLLIAGLAVRRSIAVSLPAPTGEYPVGRMITQWTDDSRQETLGGSGGPRKIAVWVWYPSAQADATPAPYMPTDWASAREADRGVGSLFFQSLGSVHTHAVEDVPLASQGAPFPVLIFQPGLGPLVPEYTTLAENLASKGYVVIGLNPTYSASLTALDGQVIPRSDRGTIPDSATPEEAQQQGERLVAVWAADVRFAIDEAERLNADPDSPFGGKLDMQHIGLWGHSLGGAAALEACYLDTRCTAAADLDGTPFGAVITNGLDKPVLFEWSEVLDRSDPMIVKSDRDVAAIFASVPEGYQVTVKGARHFNFTDLAAEFNPVGHLLGVIGPIDGARGLRISADYLAAFFGKTLRAQDSPLLHESPTSYPEVEFQSHR